MDFIRSLLEQQPLLAIFLTIAIGYVAGEITVKGFSLGVGAVLFVGLGVGYLVPKSAPPTILGTFGLALFLYAVGIQYGKQFFIGLTSTKGLKANMAAFVGVAVAGGLCLLFFHTMGISIGYALGLFAGAGTSTPTLQAAIDQLHSGDPAVGYSVSYPFGVAGPILFLYFTQRFLKPRIDLPTGAGMDLLEIAVLRSEHFGRRLGDVTAGLPADPRIVAVRRDGRNQPATPELVLAEQDVLLAVASSKAILDEVRRSLGDVAPGRVTEDRRDLDYLRVFASRPTVVGRTLGDLALSGDRSAAVAQVRRGDADLLPHPDLVLEYGASVGMLAHPGDFPALRQFFGDSIKGTAEFSYVSIGLGMALGFLVGAIDIPIPGVGPIHLGMSGVLIVALVLGQRRRTAGLSWTRRLRRISCCATSG